MSKRNIREEIRSTINYEFFLNFMGIMRTKVEDGIRQKMVEPLLNWQHNELKYRFSINKTLSLEFGNYIMVVETIYKVIS